MAGTKCNNWLLMLEFVDHIPPLCGVLVLEVSGCWLGCGAPVSESAEIEGHCIANGPNRIVGVFGNG